MLVEAVTNDENEDARADEGEETIDEFSSAGAISGYTLPLGASKGDIANSAPRRAKKRRRS